MKEMRHDDAMKAYRLFFPSKIYDLTGFSISVQNRAITLYGRGGEILAGRVFDMVPTKVEIARYLEMHTDSRPYDIYEELISSGAVGRFGGDLRMTEKTAMLFSQIPDWAVSLVPVEEYKPTTDPLFLPPPGPRSANGRVRPGRSYRFL